MAHLEDLKRAHAEILAKFEQWTAAHAWTSFHDSHYDWFAFPIDRRSNGTGDRFRLTPEVTAALVSDAAFIAAFRRGITLATMAWGWDISTGQPVASPEVGQAWQDWSVRLYKMGLSCICLGQFDLLAALRVMAGHFVATHRHVGGIQKALTRWHTDQSEHATD